MNMPPEHRLRRLHWVMVLLLAVVLAGYWVYANLLRPIPFFLQGNYDPQIPYFLNSLSIFKSRPYMYYHHPGTPLSLIGTFLLALLRPITGATSRAFVDHMLSQPEQFLLAAHAVQGLLTIAMVSLLAAKAVSVRKGVDLLLAAAVAVLPLASHPRLALGALEYWNQNYLGYALGPLLSLLLWVRLRKGGTLSWLEITGFGVLAGMLGSIQLYYVTWIIGVSLSAGLFEGLQRRSFGRGLFAALLASISGLAGFFVAFLPLLHRTREYSWWIRGLLTHQGRNQTGAPGFTSLASLQEHLQQLWGQAPTPFIAAALIAALVLVAVAAGRGRGGFTPGAAAVTVGFGAQAAALIFVVLKHPGPYYLLGVAALLPVLAAPSLDSLGQLGQGPRRFLVAGALACLGVFVAGLVRSVAEHDQPLVWYDGARAELETIMADQASRAAKDRDSLVIVWGYGSPSYCYGLRYGDLFTDSAFRREIGLLCPREWSYDSWSQQLNTPEGSFAFTGEEPWDILIAPDQYLPEDAQQFGEVRSLRSGGLTVILRQVSGR